MVPDKKYYKLLHERADWAVTPSSCPVTLSVENRI